MILSCLSSCLFRLEKKKIIEFGGVIFNDTFLDPKEAHLEAEIGVHLEQSFAAGLLKQEGCTQ